MRIRSPKQVTVALTSVLLMGTATLTLQAASTESNLDKSFPVKPGGQLVIDADRGSVEITTSERSDVQVAVSRKISNVSKANAEEVFTAHQVTFNQDGDRVEVRAQMQKGFMEWSNRGAQNLQVRYRILAPKQFDFDLRTAAGDITSTDVQGKVKARTSGGSLKFASVEGPFDGATSAGDVNLGNVTGLVTVKTSGGSVRLGDTSADTSVETSAGSINVKSAKARLKAVTHGGEIKLGELEGPAELDTSAGSISVKSSAAPLTAKTSGGAVKIERARDTVVARTSAGSISVNFYAQPHGDCTLTTSGGGIVVRLVDQLAFDVEANTSGGEVKTEIPVLAEVVGKHKADELKGKLNGGGKALVLKTSAGDISIRKLEPEKER